MPNTLFIILAVLMLVAAMMIIVIPLVRRGDPSPIAAGAIIATVPLMAVILYVSYSNWPWDLAELPQQAQTAQSEEVASVAEMVAGLEQKLQANPDDAEGWQMLGRSYAVLSRYPEAVDAYARARELSDDQDVHALTGYAEALAMLRGGAMDDEIATLFDQALLIAPNDRKALWYGGLAAYEQGRAEVARGRWQQLLALNPPEQMAVLLREQIAAVDAMLGNTPAGSADFAGTQTPAVAGLALQISLAPELAGRARPDAAVFVLAKQAGAPGPPLAVVRRLVSDLPLELVLTDADAMVPGRVLSAHDNVEVVARIALSGTPTAQTGDLSGSKMVASTGNATIIINKVVSN